MAAPLRCSLVFLCMVGSAARECPSEGCEASKGGSLLQANAAQSRLKLNHSQVGPKLEKLHTFNSEKAAFCGDLGVFRNSGLWGFRLSEWQTP